MIAAAIVGLIGPTVEVAAETAAPAAVSVSAPLSEPLTATVFGTSIKYHDLGSGPVIVLLHGMGSSSDGDWGRVMPALATNHRVLALDQLGFGKSDKPLIDYSIQTWVDMLGEFLRQQQVGEFTLMGESLGGWIAAKYTAQALSGLTAGGPALALPKPSRLVLCDSAGRRESVVAMVSHKPSPSEPPAASLAGQKALLSKVFADPSWVTPDGLRTGLAWSIAKGDAWTIRSVLRNPAMIDEALSARDYAAIAIPTLVVWGERDALIPIADGRYMARQIKGARFATVAGSGHAPMIERPDAFLETVGSFLQ
ncbi:alpha/beta hydrolase [soil metagenome]